MTISYQGCTDDELLGALRAHEEKLSELLLAARPQIAELQATADQLERELLDPLEKSLNDLMGTVGLTVDEFIASSKIQSGRTREEIEQAITNFGLPISNGRVLTPGDIDLKAVRLLTRLLGSFEAVKVALADYKTPIYEDTRERPNNFLLVVTYKKFEIVKGDLCRPDYEKTTEILLGINKAIPRILQEHPELGRDDLILYFFWLGKPEASQRTKDIALGLGLTEQEYISNVFDAPAFDPKDVWYLDTIFENDLPDILEKVPDINPTPTPEEIIDCINRSGILQATPGRSNEYDVTDYGNMACMLLVAMDFEKTFGSDKKSSSACLDASIDMNILMNGVFGAINAANKVLNSLLAEASQAFAGTLNRLTSLFGCIDNFVLKLASCFFKGVTLNVPVKWASGILDKIEGGIKLFDKFFTMVSQILNLAAPLACIKASIVGVLRASGLQSAVEDKLGSKIPGIACLSRIVGFDVCLDAEFKIGQIEATFAMQTIAVTLNQLRGTLAMIHSFSIGFNDAINERDLTCLPVESAVLLTKLGLRTALVSAGLPL